MEYKIIEKIAFKVVGEAFKVSAKNGENLIRIPEIWREFNESGKATELCEEFKAIDMYGICLDTNKENFTYLIGVRGGEGYRGRQHVVRTIPKATWAVFPVTGPMPTSIQRTFKRVFQEWFPTSGYEQAVGPVIEVYPEGDSTSINYYSEIWIPIKKTVRNPEGAFSHSFA